MFWDDSLDNWRGQKKNPSQLSLSSYYLWSADCRNIRVFSERSASSRAILLEREKYKGSKGSKNISDALFNY